ncbi:MAG: hypothetical protein OXU66_11300 [Gammaproteobacteria bacterium]|nr:hypothetical protein [Gammaproteobacteria bacterium]MDD9896421.1 hypothetical protein [Gammaproteobacteria bacterium]MDD9959516.1 hypothetical protein [Gammaproteobacteria bacterium]
MESIARNIAAILIGAIVGSLVNIGLILVGSSIIPAPAGVDVTNAESIAAAMDQFQVQHFIFPFLAHALGTLVGAVIAFLVAARNKNIFAYAVGVLFLIAGVANSFMIPAPTWFVVADILAAYIPMAWFGIQIGSRINPGISMESEAREGGS